MEIQISDRLKIINPSTKILAEVRAELTIENPAWLENLRMRRWNGRTPEFLKYYHKNDGILEVPRGFTRKLIALAKSYGEEIKIIDKRRLLLKFSGRVLQYLGRVLRPAPGKKKAKIFDYVDSKIGVLKSSALSRQRVYLYGK